MLHSAVPLSNGRSALEAESYEIRIVDFSETPFGRYVDDGPESGQVFRDNVLIPALNQHAHLTLILDGVEGLPSSFWEEVMGGLVRQGWGVGDLKERIEIVTTEAELETYVRLGWRYAEEAASKRQH